METEVAHPSTSLDTMPPPPKHDRMPLWRIIGCTLAMCGVQVCYSAQINQGTPELLLLGISERAVSIAWLAGPLSGLIVQPLVGIASDACSSPFGRRRPFLIVGSIFSAAALLLFSNARPLADLLASKETAPNLALALAIFAFFLLDFSLQAVHGPLRMLVTEAIPKPQRALGNSYIGAFSGLGLLIGGLLTSVNLKTVLVFFRSNVQALFAIAAVLLLLTVAICVTLTPEEPSGHGGGYAPVSQTHDENRHLQLGTDQGTPGLRAVVVSLRGAPRPFWQVFTVHFFTWCGMFALFVYINTWVGRSVYLGDGTAKPGSAGRKTFEQGVRFGGKGNALMALVTLVYALALPGLLAKFGTVPVYTFSHVIEAACCFSVPLIRGTVGQQQPSTLLRAFALMDFGSFGVFFATTMCVPWTLVGNALESDPWYAQRVGFFQTFFHTSQNFAMLFVTALLAPILMALGEDDPAYVMCFGGFFAVAGAILVVVLRVDMFNGEDKDKMED